MSNDEVTKNYGKFCGYVPGDPSTDQGCDEATVLAGWQTDGVLMGGEYHKIAGSLAVDGSNAEEVRTALWLFENVMFGVGLPQAWVDAMSTMKDGFVWAKAGPAVPNNGHCFGAMAYGPKDKAIKIATWGMLGEITDEAVAYYTSAAQGGQLFTVLSQDSIIKATAKAPNGFDFTQLQADLQALA